MAEYEMQEMNLPNKEGKHVCYPRLLLRGQVDAEYIAGRLAQGSTFQHGEIIGLLRGLSDEIAHQLAQGKSVKLDGIGTFTAALALREDREQEIAEEKGSRHNAQSIRVSGVNFRAEKEFVFETARYCKLERAQRKFLRSSQKYTPEQRLKLAQEYLADHPFLTIKCYAELTGLRPTTASYELKKWADQPDSGISTSGRNTHKVYVSAS